MVSHLLVETLAPAVLHPMPMAPRILGGTASIALAADIGTALGVVPCERTIERFADGEVHVVVGERVRGDDLYVVQSTSPPADGHLVELLVVADACRRAGAARLTAVVPYFAYARQDRRASGREAVAARVVADLLENAGFARVVTVDLHAPAIEGFFRIPLEHLSAVRLLAATLPAPADAVIVAPDLGAAKLAERYQQVLQLPIVVLHKTRVSGSEVALRGIVGDVRNRAPIIVDDMITTGGTIEMAVKGLLEAGCRPQVIVSATHALFAGPSAARLRDLPIVHLTGTDSVAASSRPEIFRPVSLAPMLADVIARLNRDQSLEGLLARS
jgi:ribose-phosphate pyrophosphokinase